MVLLKAAAIDFSNPAVFVGEEGTSPGVLYTQAINFHPGELATMACVGDKLLYKGATGSLAVVINTELLTEIGVMQLHGRGTFASADSSGAAPAALSTAGASAMQLRQEAGEVSAGLCRIVEQVMSAGASNYNLAQLRALLEQVTCQNCGTRVESAACSCGTSLEDYCVSCGGAVQGEGDGCGCDGRVPLQDLLEARAWLSKFMTAGGAAMGAKPITEVLSRVETEPAAPVVPMSGSSVRFVSDGRHLICVLEEPAIPSPDRTAALPQAERAARTSGSSGDVVLSLHAFDSQRTFAHVKSLPLTRMYASARHFVTEFS